MICMMLAFGSLNWALSTVCVFYNYFFLHECSGGKALFFRLSKSRIFYVSEEIYKLIRNPNWNKLQIFFGRIPFCKSFLNPIMQKFGLETKVENLHFGVIAHLTRHSSVEFTLIVEIPKLLIHFPWMEHSCERTDRTKIKENTMK